MTDVNEYFKTTNTKTKLSEAKMLLAAAITMITGKVSLKKFKNKHTQVVFDNLEARVKVAKQCLKERRGPTKAEIKSVN